LRFHHLRRGGRYLRVADPEWSNPLDGSFSMRRGGRWNAPGSFAVVYLNRTLGAARANVALRFAGLPFDVEDLDPAAAPVLVASDVPEDDFVDVVSDEGCRASGLPVSYPMDGSGDVVGRSVCQPIGAAAWEAGEPGIACRSAADGAARDDEELAWFERGDGLTVTTTTPFDDWFWGAGR